jgi:hypothetical protein
MAIPLGPSRSAPVAGLRSSGHELLDQQANFWTATADPAHEPARRRAPRGSPAPTHTPRTW